MRQIFGDIGWEKKAMVFFAAMAILTLLGPFGTYEDLSLAARTVFWVVVVGGVGFFMHITMTLALASPHLGALAQVPRLAVGAIMGGLPGAAVVVFVNQVFRPPTVGPDSLPHIWMQVAVIGFAIGLVEYIDWGFNKPLASAPKRTAFHDRLPHEIGGDIISLSMQDHYVEVTTTKGTHLILMRLSDAMTELADIPGRQVHRSHWVALSHVVGIEKSGHRRWVSLSNGRSLPVSDTYAEALAEGANITS